MRPAPAKDKWSVKIVGQDRMKKPAIIYDAQGNPTGEGGDHRDEPVPPATQALIETRVNAGIADIREHNRDDLQDLARDQTKKWRFIALISCCLTAVMTIFGLFSWFIAPHQIKVWIGRQVDRKLTEPMLRESADRVINDKMAAYVTDKLQPVSQQGELLSHRIANTEIDIAAKQAALSTQQVALAEQLKIAELAVSAKAGTREAYNALVQIAGVAPSNDFLRASMKELELFYDALWYQDRYDILVQTDTLADPGYASDELVSSMLDGPDYCEEAAINSLGKSKSKAAVGALCGKAKQSKNLHAASRAIWALQEITGETFRPLAFEAVAAWWDRNHTNALYNGNYRNYANVVRTMYQQPLTLQRAEECAKQLDETILSDSDALHARCLKAALLLALSRKDEAASLLDDVRKKRSDYYWLYVWDAALQLKTNNVEKSVEFLNRAFDKNPSSAVEATVRLWNVFDPVKGSTNVNWPSVKKKAQP